jgi:hypothetical protein
MTTDGNDGRGSGGFSRTSSRSYKRFVLVIGASAAVAIISIIAVSFFAGPELPAAIIVQPQSPSAGSLAVVQGGGFSPGDEVRISFNGEEIGETDPEVVIVGGFGEFNASIIIPSEVESDQNIIEAMDESGNAAVTTIRLTGEQTENTSFVEPV